MWRMLAMAIAITQCAGGVLLVDEIDTGLHYSVMSQMWSLIYNAAKDLDVQVFATNHSYDCVYSLAQICSNRDMQKSVTVQRIEAGKKRSVPYDEAEITVAATRDIQVR
jgi:predicted ATP-dependent endonuclease of OLD family